jgi:prevent-host-death family protein
MKQIPAAVFKTKCLAVIDEVQSKREPVLITKHGKPVAKLVPADDQPGSIFGFYAGKGEIVDDVLAPALTPAEWGELY